MYAHDKLINEYILRVIQFSISPTGAELRDRCDTARELTGSTNMDEEDDCW